VITYVVVRRVHRRDDEISVHLSRGSADEAVQDFIDQYEDLKYKWNDVEWDEGASDEITVRCARAHEGRGAPRVHIQRVEARP
jgi:hypothetical protein